MPYVSAADVRAAISYPSSSAPVSDANILSFILDAEEEIENIYHTKFGNVEDSGTATSGTTTTLTDSGKTFTANAYVGYVVWVYGGTGAGQYREITSNTTTALTVSPAFGTAPASGSTYRITKLGYKEETVDGSGTDTMFVTKQPLINLNALAIDDTDITLSAVYQYNDSGKLILGQAAEESTFLNSFPQLVELKYAFGVYPIPRPIKRLCVLIAGIRTLISQIAGTYDDFTTVSLPGGFSGSKGEPYTNIREAVYNMQAEAKGIVFGYQGDQLGGNFNVSGTYRPFTNFG